MTSPPAFLPPIRFAIAACGAIAQRHAEILRSTPGAVLAAVCDPDESRARAFAAKHGNPPVFLSTDSLFAAGVCDALVVCAPSGLHGEWVAAAARAGAHVLVEKPLEITVARCEAAIEAAARARVRLGVVYQRRALELFRRVQATIARGALGPLTLADASIKWFRTPEYYAASRWRGTREIDGGGVLANQGVHVLDVLAWMGGGVEAVRAMTATRAHAIATEDTAVALLRYRNGAIGSLQATTAANPGEPMTFAFHGPRGTIVLENEKVKRWIEDGVDRTAERQAEEKTLPGYGDPHAGHRALILDFVAAIREAREPLVTGALARESVSVLEAIYASAASGVEQKV